MPRHRPSIVAFSAAWLIATVPASAQAVPEGQSCGGLLCDMGVFGHKVPPAPATPAQTPTPDQTATIVPAPVAAPVPAPDPPPHMAPKKKRVARSASPKIVSVKAKPAATAATVTHATGATSQPAGTFGGTPTGEPPSSPADMFQPIYR